MLNHRVTTIVGAAVALALFTSEARAQSVCDAATVEQARVALDRHADSAATWNLAWTVSYGVLAAGQTGLALAEYTPGREFDDAARASMYIGAGKAVIGMLSRIVLPLKVRRVKASGDACADAAAIDRATARAGRKQRNTFWLQLGGGAALHLLGGGYLVKYEDSWRDAITSLALGVVVSGVTLYTMPKGSWWHRQPVQVAPTLSANGGAGLMVVGAF